MTAGIEALNVYCGVAQIPVRTLFEGRGLDTDRIGNLMMRNRSVGLPFEDPVSNAVNAAKPVVDLMDPADKSRIELLITSTESGLDYSKSVASYVHEYLGLPATCRVVEVKQACYAATAAVQMAVAYVASGISPGAKALVIATDVALVDERGQYAEPATGAGAAAVLIGEDPRVLTVDLGAFGNHSYETLDSARPTPTFDIADSDRSLFAYLDCLSNCFEDYRSRVEDVDFATTFDYLAMHTPFAGMVKAAHRKLMREFAGIPPARAEEDFTRRVLPSLAYPSVVGNLCSGSVYLALCSLIDHAELAELDGGARVGLYSYGSGCSSEFFSGLVDQRSAEALAPMRIGEHLEGRCELTFEEYAAVLPANLTCLVPEQDRTVDVTAYDDILGRARIDRDLLVNTGTKDYHRTYEWLNT
ncbi:hydroxymethylglutaryl-CoA synthase [Sphaerisporangium rubeum]|uniref:Polyketide biosynthesis 3-hydroxy-3-methylglutaryl-CoA synthase-like enzyme PksG n=1 Tax=Sphaerisporangium rubeum TaxID=321317 RepID=A0A7X0IL43_9ACTN|nr:hydroxymethylglutaryl-CoA synthase family protein [Sphaerisporangium rubeum]MBB6475692.1 polyketide biosynthesis 3-hydroxy-3-methylglutaryl-CoA synthase-like enzyme PksG [Sphaerisporangium rubeum]